MKKYNNRNYTLEYYRKDINLNKFYKKILILNLFLDISENKDNIYYILYDIFYWDQKIEWYLYKPYYLSYFYKYKKILKWNYVRLFNFIYKKKYVNKVIKNINLWENWKEETQKFMDKKIQSFYIFKLEIINFKFKRYYYYFMNKPIIFCNNIKIFSESMYIYLYIKFFFNKFVYIKKNNNKFLFFNLNYFVLNYKLIYIILSLNYLWTDQLLSIFFYRKNKLKILYYLIKEKHNLKNLLLNFYNFKNYKNLVRELVVFEKLKKRIRLRRKKGEKKIILKKKFFINKRKRRTNNQILMALIKKFYLNKSFYYNIIYNNKNIIKTHLININKFLIIFFKNINFLYEDENFIDIDSLYAYYLPLSRKRNLYKFSKSITYANTSFDLWHGKLNKNNTIYLQNFTNIKGINNIGNIKNFNKITINNLRKYLYNFENNKIKKYKKFFIILNNLIILMRFYKNHLFLLKNLDFIFNIYFWLILFLNLLNKSKIIYIKNILNYTSFLKLIQQIYDKKFNWFNLDNFDIFLYVITLKNSILKLKCKFNFILQEVCLYLYYYNLNIKYIINELNFNFGNAAIFENKRNVFIGYLNCEINYFLCLNLIKKSIQNFEDSYFILILKNFFFNCQLSIDFIKKNIILYFNLLELNYKLVDNFIVVLFKYLEINTEIFYIRVKNVILFCYNNNIKLFFNFLFNNFILLFLYYFLKIYFTFCSFVDLNIKNLIFLNFLIFNNKNNKIDIKPSKFELSKILLFYNFIKIHNKKIIIKAANYLLNYSINRILNYFLNIWVELNYYFKFKKYKNLNFFRLILYNSSFFTINLKLKKQKKILNYTNFKKIFKLNYYKINHTKLNNKILKKYILNNNKLNINLLKHFIK